MLLRSASGPEVKGSAIRRGIGNYSPERGRASVTFITELSALLGKQCTPFNPAFPFSLHSTPPSIYSFSSSNLNPTDPECLFLSFVFPPFILARPLPISPLLALGEKERERESERVRERERERETGCYLMGHRLNYDRALFLFSPFFLLLSVRSFNRAFNAHIAGYLAKFRDSPLFVANSLQNYSAIEHDDLGVV